MEQWHHARDGFRPFHRGFQQAAFGTIFVSNLGAMQKNSGPGIYSADELTVHTTQGGDHLTSAIF